MIGGGQEHGSSERGCQELEEEISAESEWRDFKVKSQATVSAVCRDSSYFLILGILFYCDTLLQSF